jgi:hypothetical protein
MEESVCYLVGVIIGMLIMWVIMTYVLSDSYIGGGPTYRNWTSGATQRFATEFSGTNQGYPGNISSTTHNPSYYETASRLSNPTPKSGTYSGLTGSVWQKDLDEQSLHNSLLTGENVNLGDVVAHEGGVLNSDLY